MLGFLRIRAPVVRKICGSATIWLLLWLAAIDLAAGAMKPLRYVEMPTILFADQDPLDGMVADLDSPSNQFNVLLLGSSLLHAATGADLLEKPIKGQARYSWSSYTKALTFDRLLRERLGIPACSFSIGVAGGMVQDDLLFLNRALEAGKKPGLLILFLAPRDFIDNRCSSPSRVEAYFLRKKPLWLQVSLKQPLAENLGRIADALSYFWRSRSEYLYVLDNTTRALFDRALNYRVPGAQHAPLPSFRPLKLRFWQESPDRRQPAAEACATSGQSKNESKTEKENAIADYRFRYLPVNYKRLDIEMKGLETILKESTRAGIITVVVNMPRGKENEGILPATFTSMFARRLALTCRNSGTPFVDFQDGSDFTADDFKDTVHLTPSGGAKLFELLSDRLAASSELRARLSERFPGP
jgi:hypothetical protein